jgi:hypothetical protein
MIPQAQKGEKIMCLFRRRKITKSNGLSKEVLRSEIQHYQKLMSESQDKNIIAQCKTMIKVNQD